MINYLWGCSMGYEPGLVSIIMPSYNTARFISESINSIISQTYSKLELIIVVYCSPDNTEEVVAYFKDERIRYLKNEKNSGAAVSRNRALREAKVEWIAFLDSDDLWIPEKLEKQINFMQENNYKFSATYCKYIDEGSNDLHEIDLCPKHITRFMNYLYNWIASQTVMYHAPTIGVIQVADLKKRNDYAIWLKAFKKSDCWCLPEVLSKYRVRGKSISHDNFWKLVKSHYTLFHEGEGMSAFISIVLTCCNMLFGLIRKTIYVRRTREE